MQKKIVFLHCNKCDNYLNSKYLNIIYLKPFYKFKCWRTCSFSNLIILCLNCYNILSNDIIFKNNIIKKKSL